MNDDEQEEEITYIPIQKFREITVVEATEVAYLNPEQFRNLEEKPYKGSSEEEFLEYIKNFDLYEFPIDLDADQIFELEKLSTDINWEEHSNSLQKGEDNWLEIAKS